MDTNGENLQDRLMQIVPSNQHHLLAPAGLYSGLAVIFIMTA
jgi:hypothetical protein